MGAKQSSPRIYAKFEGEKKEGESRVLRHVMNILKPTDPGTMLEEFM
jgi:hypothetical protein